jgi:excisionase family DNA binding protein
MKKDKPIWLTRKEAADYLGVKPATLRHWAATGQYQLPYVKFGYRVKYDKQDLDDLIKKNTVTWTEE